jgi:hypothetical protein
MTRPDPNNAVRQARTRQRKLDAGQVRVTVWVPAAGEQQVLDLAARLRDAVQSATPAAPVAADSCAKRQVWRDSS